MKPLTQAQWLRESLGWFAGCVAAYYWPGFLLKWLIDVRLVTQGSSLIALYWLITILGIHGVLWWQMRRGVGSETGGAVGTQVVASFWLTFLVIFQIICSLALVFILVFAVALGASDEPFLKF